MKRITLEQSIAKCKEEVRELVWDGLLAGKDATSFSVLHDVTDANVLGYLCDGDATMPADKRVEFVDAAGVIPADSTSDEDNDRWMAFGNAMQDAVHEWLAAGGAKDFPTKCQCECERVHTMKPGCNADVAASTVVDETPVCGRCAVILTEVYV